ncbi:MAG: nucleotidyl transferase AbiEii/AbiGii toxin family protein [Chloroflexota bacterium]
MLTARCFTPDWIREQRRRLSARDPLLVETCIYAFELVGRLAAAGFDFVFKGGTSLLLHIQPPRRLSIDVDIATAASLDELQRALREVCRPPFGDFVYQDWRDRENPPTRHFQIPYDSPTQGKPWPLQLDVLLGDVTYPVIETRTIALDMLDIETPQAVRIPSIDCLLGDKLTAFAPATIGVLYDPPPRTPGGKKPDPKPIRVLKQLFDVGQLFTIAKDLHTVDETYDRLFAVQNPARGGGHTREQCLDDTIDAAYWISQMDIRHQERNAKTDLLRRGIKALDSHMLGPSFEIRAAKIPAARAALVAALLRTGRLDRPLSALRTVPRPEELAAVTIEGRFERLTALRKTSLEAFHFWREASRILGSA